MDEDVTRYEIPSFGALNFVLRQALGGVTQSLVLDAHSKSLNPRSSTSNCPMTFPSHGVKHV